MPHYGKISIAGYNTDITGKLVLPVITTASWKISIAGYNNDITVN